MLVQKPFECRAGNAWRILENNFAKSDAFHSSSAIALLEMSSNVLRSRRRISVTEEHTASVDPRV